MAELPKALESNMEAGLLDADHSSTVLALEGIIARLGDLEVDLEQVIVRLQRREDAALTLLVEAAKGLAREAGQLWRLAEGRT